jgi:WD40 repeat protein
MPFVTKPSTSIGNRVPTALRRSILVAVVVLWAATDTNGQEPRTWVLSDAHDNTILHLAFSPDGRILASSSLDGTIKL